MQYQWDPSIAIATILAIAAILAITTILAIADALAIAATLAKKIRTQMPNCTQPSLKESSIELCFIQEYPQSRAAIRKKKKPAGSTVVMLEMSSICGAL